MTLKLHKMKFDAYHGVYDWEHRQPRPYEVNISLEADFTKAMHTDEITHTIDYQEVYLLTKAEMSIPSKLIEHIAYRIAHRILDQFEMLNCVSVTILKLQPPIPEADIEYTSYEYTATRLKV